MRDIARSNGDYTNTGILDGYFVLDSDIAYNGEFESLTNSGKLWSINETLKKSDSTRNWQNSALYGFKGVFDGRGYNVDGLTIQDLGNESGGIIGYMNDEGVFKNVSFTNATVYENSGYVCFMGGGLIENVQISFIQLGKGGKTNGIDSYSPRAMGAFYTFLKTDKPTIKNCVVDAIGAKIYYEVGSQGQPNIRLGARAYKGKVENLIVLCDGEYGDAILSKPVSSVTAVSYSAFINDNKCQSAIKALGDLWSIKGGLPFMRSLAEKVVVDVDFVNINTTVNSGASITIKANSKYSEITVDRLYDGVTFENGVLSVAESAIGGTVKVTVRSLVNESFKEAEITIKSTKNVSPEQKDTILLEETDTGIDLSFASEYLGESVSLTYKGAVLGEGAIADGKLTVNLSGITDRGELTFLASTLKDNITYTFNVNVLLATKIIRNADDLNAIRVTQENINNNTSIFGYYVLANDISLGWGTLPETSLTYTATVPSYKADFGFRGTFDGRGHTISRFVVTKNGLFEHVGRGAVIKNVNFDKMTYNKAYYATLFGFTVREAEITDVNISLAGYNMLDSDKYCQGFLAARYMQDNKLTNVKIDASDFEVYTVFGQTVSNNTCNGVDIKVKSYTTLGFINDTVSDATMVHEMDGVEVITSGTSTEA